MEIRQCADDVIVELSDSESSGSGKSAVCQKSWSGRTVVVIPKSKEFTGNSESLSTVHPAAILQRAVTTLPPPLVDYHPVDLYERASSQSTSTISSEFVPGKAYHKIKATLREEKVVPRIEDPNGQREDRLRKRRTVRGLKESPRMEKLLELIRSPHPVADQISAFKAFFKDSKTSKIKNPKSGEGCPSDPETHKPIKNDDIKMEEVEDKNEDNKEKEPPEEEEEPQMEITDIAWLVDKRFQEDFSPAEIAVEIKKILSATIKRTPTDMELILKEFFQVLLYDIKKSSIPLEFYAELICMTMIFIRCPKPRAFTDDSLVKTNLAAPIDSFMKTLVVPISKDQTIFLCSLLPYMGKFSELPLDHSSDIVRLIGFCIESLSKWSNHPTPDYFESSSLMLDGLKETLLILKAAFMVEFGLQSSLFSSFKKIFEPQVDAFENKIKDIIFNSFCETKMRNDYLDLLLKFDRVFKPRL